MKKIYVQKNEQLLKSINFFRKKDVCIIEYCGQDLIISDTLVITDRDSMDEIPKCNIIVWNELRSSVTQNAYDELMYNYDYYYLRHSIDKASQPDVDTVIVGSSYLRFCIDDDMLDKEVNCSFASQDLYYSKLIIEKILSRNLNIRNVVLGGGYYYPYSDLSKTKNEGEIQRVARTYFPIFGDAHNATILPSCIRMIGQSDIIDVEKMAISIIESVVLKKNYFSNIKNRNQMAHRVWENVENDWEYLTPPERYRACEIRTNAHNKNIEHTLTFKENEIILNDIVQMCAERNINVIYLTAPATQDYVKLLNPRYKENVYEMMDRVKYPIHMIDLFDCEGFSAEDFVDMDHMSDLGASKVTSILKDFLLTI